MDNSKLLEAAIAAAMQAGTALMDNYRQSMQTTVKESVRDISSRADHAAEDAAIAVLRNQYAHLPVLSEELGFTGVDHGDGCWVVDALDGTVNYLQQVPFFSVSIAFIREGIPQVGVVYAPLVDDIYYGAERIGVFKNQRAIHTPDRPPEDSLFAATFSGKNYDPDRRKQEFALFGEVNDHSRGVLRTGSAALNLAYLAEGRFNGCWGKANKTWDISAGLLLAKLAGATLYSVEADAQRHLMHYLAAPPQNYNWLEPQVTVLFSA